MRLMRNAILSIVIFLISLILASISSASVVTVDVAAKKATSDVTSLDPLSVKVAGNQIGVFVKNTIPEPQLFTLKFNGLKDLVYDLYINQMYKGSKSAKEFEVGDEYRVDGVVTDPDMTKCLSAVSDSAAKASIRLSKSNDPEAKRICYTLNQAKEWAQSSVKLDQAFRTINVILVPSGTRMQPMTWWKRMDDYETAHAVTRACWLVQQARDRMSRVITNPVLRNEAVLAMTPVEFTANYSMQNGKPHVTAKLLNNCNLPVSGAVSLALPKGWKTTAKKLDFTELKSGASFCLSFDLIAPSKQASPPDSLPMAASFTIRQDELVASLKLKTTANKT